jgi:hypothetical protein
MPSTAISAQGSIFSVGTGSGGAKPITGVVVGNPTVITSVAHGLNNGDVATLAGLTGVDAATLNGNTYTVKYKTANTFAVDIDTTGKAITATGTATPVIYTVVANIHDYSGFDGAAAELDKTNIASTAKEFMLGLVDPGQFTMNLDGDLNDPGQAALRQKQQSGVITNFKLVLPGIVANLTYSFTGYVKKFASTGGVDAIYKVNCDIRISGPVTLA